MTTIKQWDEEIKTLNYVDLIHYRSNLKNLLEWRFFKTAYEDYGLQIIINLINSEIERRYKFQELGKCKKCNSKMIFIDEKNFTYCCDNCTYIDKLN